MEWYQSRIKLFENRWVEMLTVISARKFVALWAVGLGLLLQNATRFGGVEYPVAVFTAGIVVWTLTEYALHRFAFHWQPSSQIMQQFVFVMHGNHHMQPNDPLRNLMPPIVSLPLGVAIWLAMVALAGPAGHWLFLGFATGYVSYDLIHYATHQWPMKGRLARILKVHHMRHHHLHQPGNYAITAVFWDGLFGTLIKTNVKGQP